MPKGRLNELGLTIVGTIIGCTLVFFIIVINDPQRNYTYYYKAFFTFLAAHFTFTWMGRLIVLNKVRKQLNEGVVQFNTLLVGANSLAYKIYNDTRAGLRTTGYYYRGFVATSDLQGDLAQFIPSLGRIDQLPKAVVDNSIHLVVIALEKRKRTWWKRLSAS